MESLPLIYNLILVLLIAALGGLTAKKLKQPLLVGYLLGGLLAAGIVGFLKPTEGIESLAEIGVAFLMFCLGIEFSFARLARVKEIAVWGGVIQILTVILIGLLFFPLFGFSFYESLFLGAVFSLSSTAVVVKILSERGEIDSLSGEIMIGWLIVQDLAVLPMVILLPVIAKSAMNPQFSVLNLTVSLLLSMLKAGGLLAIIFWLGKQAVPRLLSWIAELNNREVLLLSVVVLCLLAAAGTAFLGLSFALGAFLAGLLVSSSSQNHAIFSEVRPLRDLFSIIFFVSLGFLVSPLFLWENLSLILILSGIVILLKFLLVTALTFYLGYHSRTAFSVGVGLIQVGEFAFVLSKLGIAENFIEKRIYGLVISVAILTMILTPLVFQRSSGIYLLSRRFVKRRLPKLYFLLFSRFERHLAMEELPFSEHIVICGYGRVGSYIGRALEMIAKPFVVIDYNYQVAAKLKKRGTAVVYGDPAEIDVLDYAQVDQAKILVIAIADLHTQRLVIENALQLKPNIEIICRTHFEEDQKILKALGVNSVVQPEFEAALSIIHRIYQKIGHGGEEIMRKIKRLKMEHGMG